jgi:hypothetical protein
VVPGAPLATAATFSPSGLSRHTAVLKEVIQRSPAMRSLCDRRYVANPIAVSTEKLYPCASSAKSAVGIELARIDPAQLPGKSAKPNATCVWQTL